MPTPPTTTISPIAEIRGRLTLFWRFGLAAALLACEKSALNLLVDFDAVHASSGLGVYLRNAQHWGLRGLVTFAAALALFSYVRGDARLRNLNVQVRGEALRLQWLAVHATLLVPLAALTFSFYGNHGLQWSATLLAPLWLLVATATVLALFAAMASWNTWRDAAAAMGSLWFYAAATAIVAASAMQLSQMLWGPTTQITFELVDHILQPLIPSLHSNATTRVLDTGRFAVEVSYLCSGLEGAGLLLAFCCAWLVYFRHEYYFPRALLIIPIGLALLFVLNVLRIAALVLIGHAGYADIAIYGFHSQAGWIAFNCTAAGIAYFSLRSSWFSRTASPATPVVTSPGTAAYLLPFLTILAVGMLSRAASGSFETLYPLRLLAAALVIGYCWPKLRALNFHFTWRGIAMGGGVFALWLVGAHFLTRGSPEPVGLAALSPLKRDLWIAARVIASVVTVPIAEELAYRGYLLRRFRSADFESVRFGDAGLWALLLSSIIFGVGHGSWWLPAIAAGLLYGLLPMRTERIGEAIAAHATTNALIAVWVLFLGQWQLW
ncbi:MAG TPA: exosortase E/protease, VPEID-CTERM system [Steroidobacteraceae bacterium]|nr:exosortase E/protease, VPEID-CTERM system [Steroidobacteraceae bacterium]